MLRTRSNASLPGTRGGATGAVEPGTYSATVRAERKSVQPTVTSKHCCRQCASSWRSCAGTQKRTRGAPPIRSARPHARSDPSRVRAWGLGAPPVMRDGRWEQAEAKALCRGAAGARMCPLRATSSSGPAGHRVGAAGGGRRRRSLGRETSMDEDEEPACPTATAGASEDCGGEEPRRRLGGRHRRKQACVPSLNGRQFSKADADARRHS